MKRFKLNLLAMSTQELHQLYTACASALENKSRGPAKNKYDESMAQELAVPVPDCAVKLIES